MLPPDGFLRFPIADADQRKRAEALQSAAEKLQTKVGKGRYGTEDHDEFLRILAQTGVTLFVSNVEISERAGMSQGYVSSLLRMQRRVRLETMLSILNAILEVARDRLEPDASAEAGSGLRPADRLREASEIAAILCALARREILAIEAQLPNDPLVAEQNARFVEVLRTLADGFEQISNLLEAYLSAPNQVSPPTQAIGRAQVLGQKLTSWLKKHGEELVGSGAKLSLMTAGVAALNVCGADMKIATGLVGAAVLGPGAASSLKKTIGTGRKKRA